MLAPFFTCPFDPTPPNASLFGVMLVLLCLEPGLIPPAPLLGGASDTHAYLLVKLCIVINLLLDFRSPWGRLLCVRLLSCLHLNGSLSAFLTDG